LIRHPTGATFSHWRRLPNSMLTATNFKNVPLDYAAAHKLKKRTNQCLLLWEKGDRGSGG
ncbi:MAG: hypothetical protein II326_07370, partial [Clostridia bacterium]|nr:hypothetical protein [Clostridia bacterium]